MKRGILAATLAVVVLTGCEAATGPVSVSETSTRYWVKRLALPDGRTVLCVTYSDGAAGGVSCDWENAR